MNYSIYQKDVLGATWPIMGVCQGFQTIAVALAGDKYDVKDSIKIHGQNRPVKWFMEPEQS